MYDLSEKMSVAEGTPLETCVVLQTCVYLNRTTTSRKSETHRYAFISRHVSSRQMAALEGTESAYCTASGMAAIACSVLQAVKTGEHVVASNR